MTQTHACTHKCMHMHAHTNTYTHTRTHTHTNTHTSIFLCSGRSILAAAFTAELLQQECRGIPSDTHTHTHTQAHTGPLLSKMKYYSACEDEEISGKRTVEGEGEGERRRERGGER